MNLYHGTTSALLPQILANGLQPRGKGRSQWKAAPSRPDCVYLSNAYPIYFAGHAAKGKDKLLILEVDVELDELLPDEDFLEQVSRTAGPAPIGASMKVRTAWYKRRLKDFASYAEDSLNHIGNAAHLGPIPVDRIKRYALMTHDRYFQLVMEGHDPMISVMNYRILSDRYHGYVKSLFDGELDSEVVTLSPN